MLTTSCKKTLVRIGGERNPAYTSTYVFPNDFPAVRADQQVDETSTPKLTKFEQLIQSESVRGTAEVLCFSPRHDQSMAEMDEDAIYSIILCWIEAYARLSKINYVNHVQIFENKGSTMGCSNPHPHGQIWATEHVPEEPGKEIKNMKKYQILNSSCLLCDYCEIEIDVKSRIVCENDTFICFVPFWAVWPYETMILPKIHLSKLTLFTEKQKTDLANILRFEMLAEPQRDITPEQSAEKLRMCPEIHYKLSFSD
ncbi:hypothetical protein HK099_002154 [Clydaea vesicula]|uniref:Galactose-1-phosphate uridylyltransferase n=1 Tax=Clydaea vesicula TaxID=447962 RepID=A0AAD5XZ82_9FUNG|nr:hypothetical protein HK099_002154 [Clydaea vesicula]